MESTRNLGAAARSSARLIRRRLRRTSHCPDTDSCNCRSAVCRTSRRHIRRNNRPILLRRLTRRCRLRRWLRRWAHPDKRYHNRRNEPRRFEGRRSWRHTQRVQADICRNMSRRHTTVSLPEGRDTSVRTSRSSRQSSSDHRSRRCTCWSRVRSRRRTCPTHTPDPARKRCRNPRSGLHRR